MCERAWRPALSARFAQVEPVFVPACSATDTATVEIYTLARPDALPIFAVVPAFESTPPAGFEVTV